MTILDKLWILTKASVMLAIILNAIVYGLLALQEIVYWLMDWHDDE